MQARVRLRGVFDHVAAMHFPFDVAVMRCPFDVASMHFPFDVDAMRYPHWNDRLHLGYAQHSNELTTKSK
uniref:Uncharacterized protein n=1 Tax=Globodera rostochiensis TaxID=31243 RepID=A0A914HMC2_GLORO